MKVIMTGGGTGGHIYPAIAIADEIKKRNADAEILFVGAELGMEGDIVPKFGYNIELIPADGFNRTNPIKNIEAANRIIRGNIKAKKIIKQFNPDFVIGTGGYASAPVVRAAQKMKIPTYIHEQNAFPGMTNKILEKKATNVFLGFEKASNYFKYPEKHVFCGNPVRKEFVEASRRQARIDLGYGDGEFVILAFGGSQGAGKINQAMMKVIEALNGVDGFRICLGTGSYYYDLILKELEDGEMKLASNITIIEYIEDMPKYLAASDLLISRSGALTVAEVTVCGIPTVFIPSPNVTNNHQYHNAKAVEELGGAVIIEEKNLENEKLISIIHKLKNDGEVLNDMMEKCRLCGKPDAVKVICDTIGI